MQDLPSACETCGRDTTGRDRCPRHPGARLLDLQDPDDRAWRDSVVALRRARRVRLLGWLGAVGLASVAFALLLNGAQFTDRAAMYQRDSTWEVVLVALAVLGSAGAIVGRAVVDMWRSWTGQDVAPELRAERRLKVRSRVQDVAGTLCLAVAYFTIDDLLVVFDGGTPGATGVLAALTMLAGIGLFIGHDRKATKLAQLEARPEPEAEPEAASVAPANHGRLRTMSRDRT